MQRNRTIESAAGQIDYGLRVRELPPRPYAERLAFLGISNERLKALNRLPIEVATPLVDWVMHLAAQALLAYPEQYPTTENNATRHASNNDAIKLLVENEVETALKDIVESIGSSDESLYRQALVEDAILQFDISSPMGKHIDEMATANAVKLESEVRKSVANIIANTRRAYLQDYAAGYSAGAYKIQEVFGLGVVPLEQDYATSANMAKADGSNHRVWKVTATAATGLVMATGTIAPAAANPNGSSSSVSAEASAAQQAPNIVSTPLAAIVEEVLTDKAAASAQPAVSASSVEAPLFVPDTSSAASAAESTATANSKVEPDKADESASKTAAKAEIDPTNAEYIKNLIENIKLSPEAYKKFSINTDYDNSFENELPGKKITEFKYFVGHGTGDVYTGVEHFIEAIGNREGNCCSVQIFIDKDAKVYQLTPFDAVTWHAPGANFIAPGAEIETEDQQFTPEQIEAFMYTYVYVWQKQGLKLNAEQLVGHEWVDKNLAETSSGKPDMPTVLVEQLRPILAKFIEELEAQGANADKPNEDTTPDNTAPTPPADDAPDDEPATPPDDEPANPDDQEPTTPPTEEPTPAPGDGTEQPPAAPADPIAEVTQPAQEADASTLVPQPSSENNAQAEVVSEDLDSKFVKFKNLIDKAIDSKDLNAILKIEGIDSIALHDDDVEILISYRALYNAILANDTAIIQMLNDFDPSTLSEEQRAAYTDAMNSVLTEDPSKDLSQAQKLAIAVINDRLGNYFEDDIAKAVAAMNKSEAESEEPDNQEAPSKHEMSKNLYNRIKSEIDSIPNRSQDQKDLLLKYAVATYKIAGEATRPEVIWAQAILEGGWDLSKSPLARDHHNVFGIKATKSWKEKGGKVVVVQTKEFVNGKYVTIDAEFKSYDTLEDAFADRAVYLANLDHYKDAIKCSDTIDGFINGLLNQLDAECNIVIPQGELGSYPYATDPNYKSILKNIIKKNHLPEIVEMFDEANKREKSKDKSQRSHEREVQMDYMRPVAGNPIISCEINGYRDKEKNGYHTGVDYDVPIGTKVMAPERGVIEETGFDDRAGYYMKIRMADERLVIFQHLSKFKAKAGESVARGEVVALSGNSGGRTTGPHLHVTVAKPKTQGFPSSGDENIADVVENPEDIW